MQQILFILNCFLHRLNGTLIVLGVLCIILQLIAIGFSGQLEGSTSIFQRTYRAQAIRLPETYDSTVPGVWTGITVSVLKISCMQELSFHATW